MSSIVVSGDTSGAVTLSAPAVAGTVTVTLPSTSGVPIQTFSDDHGSWRYDTVIAHATDELVAHELNDESHEVRWVEIEKVEELTLHPSFAKSWPTLKGLVQAL